jgi:hypothetical protein
MENADLVYEMARRLDMVIEVKKEGKYIGKYKFIDGKLHKLKENEKLNDNSKEEEMR